MNMLWIRVTFIVAALYDGVLGIAFLFAGPWIYRTFNVTPPNHWAYVQFSAGLLLIFAAMFASVARDPRGRRVLIPYGIALKVVYCSLAFYYWLTTDIPGMWKPFAAIDLLMIALFAAAYAVTGRRSPHA